MYKIKQIPQDFIVIENAKHELNDKGSYSLIKVNKTNYTTPKTAKLLSNYFNVELKKIGFAGNKDKVAKTSQYMSIEGNIKNKIQNFDIDEIQIEYLGQISERINLGNLDSNSFILTIRNLEKNSISKKEILHLAKNIPNYYGEQRFSNNNKDTGKAIIKNDFKKAIELILENNGYEEKIIKEYLEKEQNNYIGAYQTLSKKSQKFFIHAYQSYLWNIFVKKYLEIKTELNKLKNIEIPILGFDTELDEYNKEIEEIYDDLMIDEEISQRDFIVRKIPYLSSEGTTRNLFIDIKDFNVIEIANDELNDNKEKIILEFTLSKGSYATTVIEHIFGNK
jgi:tRNA pseudouridine13 synthase